MGHRTQVTLTDKQYTRLLDESRRTGLAVSALVRRAVEHSYGAPSKEDMLRGLEESFGAWKDRDFEGADYVDGLRRGMARRLAD